MSAYTEIKRLYTRNGQPPIDFHVHVGPEFLARRYDAITIAEEAYAAGFGCVLKNHFIPTTGFAAQARTHRPVTILGSVTLNYAVGGLNAQAVRGAQSANKATSLSSTPDPLPFVVWMPTIHAESHLMHTGRRDIVPAWGVDERYCQAFKKGTGITIWDGSVPNSGLCAAVYDILDLIKAYDLILATGHLSASEVKALVSAAHERGLRRIIITHPFFPATGLTVRDQAALSERDGVYIEHCYSNLEIDKIPITDYARSIREASPRNVILSTDLGQPHTPIVSDGLVDFFRELHAHGIAEDALVEMMAENPHRLLKRP